MSAPGTQPASAEDRVKELEARVGKLEKKPKDAWDRLQALSGVIAAVVVALSGYFVTGSINRALQERQFQMSSAKDMQELLAKLNDPNTGFSDKQSTALVLAAFGRYAIQPLINQVQSGDPIRMVAAEEGLRAIGQSEPEYTCAALAHVLENRTRVFAWQTHLSVIRLLRDTDCRGAAPVLVRYRATLNDANRYAAIVREEPAPTPESVDRLRAETRGALESFGVAER